MASCGTQRIIPKAVNTINTAQLADLNLTRGDYEVLNTISAEAVINYSQNGSNIKISSDDDEFSLSCFPLPKKKGWQITYTGIMLQGYLHGDYANRNDDDIPQPENIARRMAIYRLINIAKQYGGDAIIEPTVATNVEQTDKKTIVYKTTVTAKVIKIKTDR